MVSLQTGLLSEQKKKLSNGAKHLLSRPWLHHRYDDKMIQTLILFAPQPQSQLKKVNQLLIINLFRNL